MLWVMCKNIPTLPGDNFLLRILFPCVYVGYQYVETITQGLQNSSRGLLNHTKLSSYPDKRCSSNSRSHINWNSK